MVNPRYLDTPNGGNEVLHAHNNSETIRNIFEGQTAGRLYNPIYDPTSTEKLADQVKAWQQNGDVVAMVFGGFDAPFHQNHQQFLLDCKAQAVPTYYERNHAELFKADWMELPQKDQEDYVRYTLADGRVKLIVSTDGDQRISASKGFNPKKGSSPRPLLGWDTRAHNLTGLAVPLAGDARTPVVDAVTIHDQLALPGTVHANPVDMVAKLQPDVWTLFYEAEDDIALASADTRLGSMDIRVIEGFDYRVDDPITGEPFSTTALVRRIKGE